MARFSSGATWKSFGFSVARDMHCISGMTTNENTASNETIYHCSHEGGEEIDVVAASPRAAAERFALDSWVAEGRDSRDSAWLSQQVYVRQGDDVERIDVTVDDEQ